MKFRFSLFIQNLKLTSISLPQPPEKLVDQFTVAEVTVLDSTVR